LFLLFSAASARESWVGVVDCCGVGGCCCVEGGWDCGRPAVGVESDRFSFIDLESESERSLEGMLESAPDLMSIPDEF